MHASSIRHLLRGTSRVLHCGQFPFAKRSYTEISVQHSMAAKLRLVQFVSKSGGERRIGVELENAGSVVDISAVDSNIPRDMRSFLESWETSTAAATQSVSIHPIIINLLNN